MSEDMLIESAIPEAIQARNLWQPLEEETENRFLRYRPGSAWMKGSRLTASEEPIYKAQLPIKISFSSQLKSAPEISGDIYVTLEQETQEEGLRFIDFVRAQWTTDAPGLYIFELDNNQFRLKNPIELTIEQSETIYLVYNEQLNISGHGATVEEARKDFESYLIDNFLFYSTQLAENLSAGARHLLAQYQNVLERK